MDSYLNLRNILERYAELLNVDEQLLKEHRRIMRSL